MRDFTQNPHSTFEDAVKAQDYTAQANNAQITGQISIDEALDQIDANELLVADVRFSLDLLREHRPGGELATAILSAEQALRRVLSLAKTIS